nr:unnamed protein product [Callosobruchus chinensis]
MTAQRSSKGQFQKLYDDLRAHPENFFKYYRMSVARFDELSQLIRPHMTYKDTNFRKAITAAEILTVTIRYDKK